MRKKLFLIPLMILFIHSSTFASECIFGIGGTEGTEIWPLVHGSSSRFVTKKLGTQVKIARREVEGDVIRVEVYELRDKINNDVYHLNVTSEDTFDGGNALGWIENFETLDVVATIHDFTIYDCTVKK